jgi:hypothetical protein
MREADLLPRVGLVPVAPEVARLTTPPHQTTLLVAVTSSNACKSAFLSLLQLSPGLYL